MVDFKELLHGDNSKSLKEEYQELMKQRSESEKSPFSKEFYKCSREVTQLGLNDRQRVKMLICICLSISERQFFRLLSEPHRQKDLSQADKYAISLILNVPTNILFPKNKKS